MKRCQHTSHQCDLTFWPVNSKFERRNTKRWWWKWHSVNSCDYIDYDQGIPRQIVSFFVINIKSSVYTPPVMLLQLTKPMSFQQLFCWRLTPHVYLQRRTTLARRFAQLTTSPSAPSQQKATEPTSPLEATASWKITTANTRINVSVELETLECSSTIFYDRIPQVLRQWVYRPSSSTTKLDELSSSLCEDKIMIWWWWW